MTALLRVIKSDNIIRKEFTIIVVHCHIVGSKKIMKWLLEIWFQTIRMLQEVELAMALLLENLTTIDCMQENQ